LDRFVSGLARFVFPVRLCFSGFGSENWFFRFDSVFALFSGLARFFSGFFGLGSVWFGFFPYKTEPAGF
jgi:hypothetical protein